MGERAIMDLGCLECDAPIHLDKFPYQEQEVKCKECGTEYTTDWDEDDEGGSCWLVRKNNPEDEND